MLAKLESISHDALVLPPDQRITLAYRLLSSIEPKPEAEAEIAWDAEILHRIAKFDAGENQTLPASAVFASLREIAPDQ